MNIVHTDNNERKDDVSADDNTNSEKLLSTYYVLGGSLRNIYTYLILATTIRGRQLSHFMNILAGH